MVSSNALFARAAQFLSKLPKEIDWDLYADIFDISDLPGKVPRLYNSQRFGDPDYPRCVLTLLKMINERDETLAFNFLRYVIAENVNIRDPEQYSRDPWIFQALNLVETTNGELPPLLPLSAESYLKIKIFPDNFYYELQAQINHSYAYGIYPAVRILSRKLIENLIIDILRKQYGLTNVELFFDTGNRKFHSFNFLLKVLNERIGDFITISTEFNSDFIRKINKFRESGNSSAHNIEVKVSKGDLDKDSADLEHIIKVLVRVYNSIVT